MQVLRPVVAPAARIPGPSETLSQRYFVSATANDWVTAGCSADVSQCAGSLVQCELGPAPCPRSEMLMLACPPNPGSERLPARPRYRTLRCALHCGRLIPSRAGHALTDDRHSAQKLVASHFLEQSARVCVRRLVFLDDQVHLRLLLCWGMVLLRHSATLFADTGLLSGQQEVQGLCGGPHGCHLRAQGTRREAQKRRSQTETLSLSPALLC